MMAGKYTRGEGGDLSRGSRVVIPWQDGVVFRCPCDEREVCISSPPHGISFSADGSLSLVGSVGSKARHDRQANWCHFHIENGDPTMCDDAKCPGGSGEIQVR